MGHLARMQTLPYLWWTSHFSLMKLFWECFLCCFSFELWMHGMRIWGAKLWREVIWLARPWTTILSNSTLLLSWKYIVTKKSCWINLAITVKESQFYSQENNSCTPCVPMFGCPIWHWNWLSFSIPLLTRLSWTNIVFSQLSLVKQGKLVSRLYSRFTSNSSVVAEF